nr:hypothetical protein [uncultured Eubacterium sp.]
MENKYRFTKEHTQVAKGVAMFLFLSGYGMFLSQQWRSYSIKDSLKRIYNIWIQYAFITIIIIALDSAFGKIQLDIRKIVLNVVALDYSYNKFAWFMITYIVIILKREIFILKLYIDNEYAQNMELEEILKKIGITKYKIQQIPEGIVINVE